MTTTTRGQCGEQSGPAPKISKRCMRVLSRARPSEEECPPAWRAVPRQVTGTGCSGVGCWENSEHGLGHPGPSVLLSTTSLHWPPALPACPLWFIPGTLRFKAFPGMGLGELVTPGALMGLLSLHMCKLGGRRVH